MTMRQTTMLPEALENFIASSEMEGVTVSETLREMCLAVVRGETTLEECLAQLKVS